MFVTVDNKPHWVESIILGLIVFLSTATALIWGLTIAAVNWVTIYPVWILLACLLFSVFCLVTRSRRKLGKLTVNAEGSRFEINDKGWFDLEELAGYESYLTEMPLVRFLSRMTVKLTHNGQTVTLVDNKALFFGSHSYSETDLYVLKKIGERNGFTEEQQKRYLLWLERVQQVSESVTS